MASRAKATSGNPRAVAVTALAKWLGRGLFPSSTIPDAPPLALRIVGGTARNLSAVEFAFGRYCRRTPDPVARAALAAGTWQLLFADDIPDYAAISETVDAVKAAHSGASGFVNAVLRNVARNATALRGEISKAPLHIRTSHPEPLVRRWAEDFGLEAAERICAADNLVPSTTAVAVPHGDGALASSLLSLWRSAGIAAEPHGFATGAFSLPHGVAVASLPGYDEGLFAIQDVATLLSVDMLAARPGETILDCCAAPGGKTMQIAAMVGGRGRVVALDSSGRRLETLRENATRLRLAGRIESAVCDATDAARLSSVTAGRRIDAALADVPCSNSGVFRRRADARWRWSPQETSRLAALQGRILANVASLAPQRMVYSTCSIDPEEDERVVETFLASEPGRPYCLLYSRKLLPDATTDGAFAALLAARSQH